MNIHNQQIIYFILSLIVITGFTYLGIYLESTYENNSTIKKPSKKWTILGGLVGFVIGFAILFFLFCS